MGQNAKNSTRTNVVRYDPVAVAAGLLVWQVILGLEQYPAEKAALKAAVEEIPREPADDR
jgi:hypothetical protein